MTAEAQVLLAVLGPIGAAILAIGGKLLDRHLKMIDKVEGAIDETVKVQAKMLERFEQHEKNLYERLKRVEDAIGIDGRLEEIQEEVRRQASNPEIHTRTPTGRHTALSSDEADEILPKPPRSSVPHTHKVRQ